MPLRHAAPSPAAAAKAVNLAVAAAKGLGVLPPVVPHGGHSRGTRDRQATRDVSPVRRQRQSLSQQMSVFAAPLPPPERRPPGDPALPVAGWTWGRATHLLCLQAREKVLGMRQRPAGHKAAPARHVEISGVPKAPPCGVLPKAPPKFKNPPMLRASAPPAPPSRPVERLTESSPSISSIAAGCCPRCWPPARRRWRQPAQRRWK